MFEIFEVPVAAGALAIAPVPGISRDYKGDAVRLMQWSPDLVISLTEWDEMAQFGAQALPDDLSEQGICWHHFPVVDFATPEQAANPAWTQIEMEALAYLRRGGRVLAHCRGGCGRSGMAALRLMIAAGHAPEDALSRLRAVRPCAVETEAQLVWSNGASWPSHL